MTRIEPVGAAPPCVAPPAAAARPAAAPPSPVAPVAVATTAPVARTAEVIDPALNIAVLEFLSPEGALARSVPSRAQLQSYEIYGLPARG